MAFQLINGGSHLQIFLDVILISLLDDIVLSLYDPMPACEDIHLLVLLADLPLPLCDSLSERLDLTILQLLSLPRHHHLILISMQYLFEFADL